MEGFSTMFGDEKDHYKDLMKKQKEKIENLKKELEITIDERKELKCDLLKAEEKSLITKRNNISNKNTLLLITKTMKKLSKSQSEPFLTRKMKILEDLKNCNTKGSIETFKNLMEKVNIKEKEKNILTLSEFLREKSKKELKTKNVLNGEKNTKNEGKPSGKEAKSVDNSGDLKMSNYNKKRWKLIGNLKEIGGKIETITKRIDKKLKTSNKMANCKFCQSEIISAQNFEDISKDSVFISKEIKKLI